MKDSYSSTSTLLGADLLKQSSVLMTRIGAKTDSRIGVRISMDDVDGFNFTAASHADIWYRVTFTHNASGTRMQVHLVSDDSSLHDETTAAASIDSDMNLDHFSVLMHSSSHTAGADSQDGHYYIRKLIVSTQAISTQ